MSFANRIKRLIIEEIARCDRYRNESYGRGVALHEVAEFLHEVRGDYGSDYALQAALLDFTAGLAESSLAVALGEYDRYQAGKTMGYNTAHNIIGGN